MLAAPPSPSRFNPRMRRPTRACSSPIRAGLLATLLAYGWTAQAASDLNFDSADAVNEGALHFLDTLPQKPVHHHQNRIRIDADSLASGWVSLSQCHDNLDAVPRAQITFREAYVRDLRVDTFGHIEHAWIEGASVQLRNIEPGARLCLSAQTRALRNTGNGYFNLINGPYMRRFLDGYYPMRVTLDVSYPSNLLKLIDISPAAQAGLNIAEQPGVIRVDALFEGKLQTLIQFEKTE